MLTFHQPLWIAAGLFCCLLLMGACRHLDRRRQDRLSNFAADSLIADLTASVSRQKRTLKKWLLLISIFLCFVALARPQYGHQWVNVKHKGIDILFALDTSKSMLAEDIRPNRLERSKLAIMDFVANLSGDRVGLLPFAGSSYLICPLTADYHAFEQSLMSLDQTTIPDSGTDIGAAIDAALKILTNEANHKILILITDGEQLQGDVAKAASHAADNGMIIHTVGVGTAEGELIPNHESGGFIQDESGTYVKSRLDEKNLKLIAETSGGLYAVLGDRGEGLEAVYREKLALVPQTEMAEKRKQVPIERFGWPISLAIVLLSLELMISGRKNSRSQTSMFSRLFRNAESTRRSAALMFAVCSSLPLLAFDLHASEAENLYAGGNYIKAGEYYQRLLERQPNNPQIIYNSGTAAYKNNLFEEAVQAFDRALTSDDLKLQEKAYFNRGNALYRQGEATLQAQPEQSITSWERAVASYEHALSLNPDNEQARANHRFVSDKLEQLKQNQQEQNSESQKNENQQKQEKNEQQGENKQKEQAESEEQGQKEQADENSQPQQDRNDGDEQQENPANKDNSEAANQGQQREQAAGSNEPSEAGERTQASNQELSDTGQSAVKELSKEEAEQLLQALKAEEGRLHFYAPSTGKKERIRQDW